MSDSLMQLRQFGTFADVIQFFDFNIWNFEIVKHSKVPKGEKVIYRCKYTSNGERCKVFMFAFQSDDGINLYQKFNHTHDQFQEYQFNLKSEKKVTWLLSLDYTLVREFYSQIHVKEFLNRTNRYKVIYDAVTRYGERTCLQCVIQRTNNAYCDAKLRLSTTGPMQTTKLLISKANHNHDVIRESQRVGFVNILPESASDEREMRVDDKITNSDSFKHEIDDELITKLILDSKLENINWIYLGRFVSIPILRVLLNAERFIKPTCIENYLECVIQCNYRNHSEDQCTAEIILAHQPNCDYVHVLKNIDTHNHSEELQESDLARNFSKDFEENIKNYIRLLSLPSEKYLIDRDCDQSYEITKNEIINLYSLGFDLKLICDYIIKQDDFILPPENDFLFIINESQNNINNSARQNYWNRVMTERNRHRTQSENNINFDVSEKFKSISDVENFLSIRNSWEFISCLQSFQGFRHFFRCTCRSDCDDQIYLSFDGIKKYILLLKSDTTKICSFKRKCDKENESNNSKKFKRDLKLLDDTSLAVNVIKRAEIYDKGFNWKLIKILYRAKDLDKYLALKKIWTSQMFDNSPEGRKYYYFCNFHPACLARLMAFHTNNLNILVYLCEARHNHDVQYDISEYEDARFEILDLYKIGFDSTSICKYLQKHCFDLPDFNIFYFVTNVTSTSSLANPKRAAYYERINNNENICTCAITLNLDDINEEEWAFDRKFSRVIPLEIFFSKLNYWVFDHTIDTEYGMQHHFSCKYALNYRIQCKSILHVVFNGLTKEIIIYRSKILHNHDFNGNPNYDLGLSDSDSDSNNEIDSTDGSSSNNNISIEGSNDAGTNNYIPILRPIKFKIKPTNKVDTMTNTIKTNGIVNVSSEVEIQKGELVNATSSNQSISSQIKEENKSSDLLSNKKVIKVAAKLDYTPILRRIKVKNKTDEPHERIAESNKNYQSSNNTLKLEKNYDFQKSFLDHVTKKAIKDTQVNGGIGEEICEVQDNNLEYMSKSINLNTACINNKSVQLNTNCDLNTSSLPNINNKMQNNIKETWSYSKKLKSLQEKHEYLSKYPTWVLSLHQKFPVRTIEYYHCTAKTKTNNPCPARIKFISSKTGLFLLRADTKHSHEKLKFPYAKYDLKTEIQKLYSLGFDLNFIQETISDNADTQVNLSYCEEIIKSLNVYHQEKIEKFSHPNYVLPENINDYADLFSDAKWLYVKKFETASDAQDFLDSGFAWEFCLKKLSSTRCEYFYKCNDLTDNYTQCNALLLFISNLISREILMYCTDFIHDHNPARDLINELYILGFDAEFIYRFLDTSNISLPSIPLFNKYLHWSRDSYPNTVFINEYNKRWKSIKQITTTVKVQDDNAWVLEGKFQSVMDIEKFLDHDGNWIFINSEEYKTGFRHFYGCLANVKYKEIECEVMIYFDFDAVEKEIRFYRFEVDHNHLNVHFESEDSQYDDLVFSDDYAEYDDE